MTPAELSDAVRRDGFCFARAADVRAALTGSPSGEPPRWGEFARSWDDLRLDEFMADGGRDRRRRHAVFSAGPGLPRLEPRQAHYQSRDYTPLNGGVARWIEPIVPEV